MYLSPAVLSLITHTFEPLRTLAIKVLVTESICTPVCTHMRETFFSVKTL